MAGRTPHEAVRKFGGAFQQALSCLTQARFSTEGYRPSDTPYSADLNGGESVALAGDPRLRLLVVLRYRIVQVDAGPTPWTVRLAAYDYELLNDDDREIVAYQWHPENLSPVTWPHLHLGRALGDLTRLAARAHLPTGLIDITDVIRLAIREFGAQAWRADWDTVLHRTRPFLPDA